MDKIFLISYDLGIPEDRTDYKKVTDYIKSFNNWAKPLLSVWLVISDVKDCKSIRNDLLGITDQNDKILVIDITRNPWATGRVSEEVNKWMQDNV